MPRLYNLILCQSCENSREKGYSAFQIFGAMGIKQLPERISFSVLASVYNPKIGKTRIEIRLIDPSGNNLASASGDMEYKGNRIVNSEYSGLNVSARFDNIEIKETGIYIVDILADNKGIGDQKFCIYQS